MCSVGCDAVRFLAPQVGDDTRRGFGKRYRAVEVFAWNAPRSGTEDVSTRERSNEEMGSAAQGAYLERAAERHEDVPTRERSSKEKNPLAGDSGF